MQIYIIFRRSPNLHFAPFLQKLTIWHILLLFLNLQKRRFLRPQFLSQKSKCTKNIKAELRVYYITNGCLCFVFRRNAYGSNFRERLSMELRRNKCVPLLPRTKFRPLRLQSVWRFAASAVGVSRVIVEPNEGWILTQLSQASVESGYEVLRSLRFKVMRTIQTVYINDSRRVIRYE